ncbi:SAM-dependent methyltransferase [Paenibacillus sp. IB182496]|uniref:SAM-dependent methyltransferase n=1 Tax=Paenibacillus sabuli TaxID=2772509 RepID=A0A927BRH5_9BACL|nr:SAM-dependent methyltransferase [Paenibacillus sabuli]MBD2844415.1 SAM-dependent methyltransferase [Paenibacillus sabuli]
MTLLSRILAAIGRAPAAGRFADAPQGEPMRCIAFRDYMAMCLYDPEAGYYRSGPARVGRQGDFYTMSGIGTVLAELVAGAVRELAEQLEAPVRITEWGGGTGQLAEQMLTVWQAGAPRWLERVAYRFIEDHPAHREAAAVRLAPWRRALGELELLGSAEAEAADREGRLEIVLANELLDAMPVHRVTLAAGRLMELGVTLAPDSGRLRECLMPLSDERLETALEQDGIALEEGQQAEVGLDAARWLSRLLASAATRAIVLLDYGDLASPLTAPHRRAGTLRAYAGHRLADPLARPGEQDLTADVNFSACMRLAAASGWQTAYQDTQQRFAVDRGILSLLAPHAELDPFGPLTRRNRAIRQLLLDEGMSTRFRVLVLTRGALRLSRQAP